MANLFIFNFNFFKKNDILFNYKKHVQNILLLTFLFISLSLFCILLLIFVADPLQVRLKGYFIEEKYYNNMRLQAAGIINNVDFDSIILGTSMLENTSAIEASTYLNGKFINLSLSGSDFYERAFVLEHALKKRPIKQIIYSLDHVFYNTRKTDNYNSVQWVSLYNSSFFYGLIVYFSKSLLKNIFNDPFNFNQIKTHATLNFFDRPQAWYMDKFHNSRFGGLKNWIQNREKQGINDFLFKTLKTTVEKIEKQESEPYKGKELIEIKEYVETYLLQYIKSYPNTKFYLCFPPYYRSYYASIRQVEYEKYSIYEDVIRFLVNQSKIFPNLEIYGFEDSTYVNHIENYKDQTHYNIDMNFYMLHSIANKKHLLTKDNIDTYLKTIESEALNFDLRALYNHACELLKLENTQHSN